jgi:hypothetical protein
VELSKEIASRWKSLKEEEKTPYYDQVSQAKQQFEEELRNYSGANQFEETK